MSSSTVNIIFLSTDDHCGFVMENLWKGLWEITAVNSLMSKKSGNRKVAMIRTGN